MNKMNKKKNTIIYEIKNKIYINLTNKCSNNCDFCVRNGREEFYNYYLWLEKEPTSEQVIKELEGYMDYEYYVFCGFGEPLYSLENMIVVANYLKKNQKYIRINTNGQADLIYKEMTSVDVAKKLAGVIDEVSISLNAPDAKSYQNICHCAFGEEGYYSMLRFASACKEQGIKVKLSIVDCVGGEQIERAKLVAQTLGVELKIRKYVK